MMKVLSGGGGFPSKAFKNITRQNRAARCHISPGAGTNKSKCLKIINHRYFLSWRVANFYEVSELSWTTGSSIAGNVNVPARTVCEYYRCQLFIFKNNFLRIYKLANPLSYL